MWIGTTCIQAEQTELGVLICCYPMMSGFQESTWLPLVGPYRTQTVPMGVRISRTDFTKMSVLALRTGARSKRRRLGVAPDSNSELL